MTVSNSEAQRAILGSFREEPIVFPKSPVVWYPGNARLEIRWPQERVIPFTPKQAELFTLFAHNPDILLRHFELSYHVYGFDSDNTRMSIKTLVRSLRERIEDIPEDPKYIRSLYARGYIFRPRGKYSP